MAGDNEINGTAWWNKSRNKFKIMRPGFSPLIRPLTKYTQMSLFSSILTCEMRQLDYIRNHRLVASWQEWLADMFHLGCTKIQKQTSKQTNKKATEPIFLKSKDFHKYSRLQGYPETLEDLATYICILVALRAG